MPDVLVRNLPEPILSALKRRAEQNRRSLQQEIVTILEAAAQEPPAASAAEVAAAFRARFAQEGRTFRDSVLDLREDRER